MTVVEIIRFATIRAGKESFQKYGLPIVLEQLNRWYKQANQEWELIPGNTTFTFTNFDTDGIFYATVPTDWMRLKTLDPYRIWRYPQVFRTTEPKTYTIEGRVIKFADVNAESSFECNYVSTGLKLVETASDASPAVDVATPEWVPDDTHSWLMYKLAIWLNPKYAQAADDRREIALIEEQFDAIRYNKQNASPLKPGMQQRVENYAADSYDTED